MISNNVDALLARMNALQQAASGDLTAASTAVPAGSPDFAHMLSDAVRGVSALQNNAAAQSQALQLGDRGVSMEQVMISLQQASLSFQGMVAVRNKLVEAYREISNLAV
jgi:flagellar hook-basal body complex protein FliE